VGEDIDDGGDLLPAERIEGMAILIGSRQSGGGCPDALQQHEDSEDVTPGHDGGIIAAAARSARAAALPSGPSRAVTPSR